MISLHRSAIAVRVNFGTGQWPINNVAFYSCGHFCDITDSNACCGCTIHRGGLLCRLCDPEFMRKETS